uniref:Exonuclease domain-containing protein n=1 Tax=Magallana gigas TaxID=29159 RepID=A0A8W8KEG3_MAGGI
MNTTDDSIIEIPPPLTKPHLTALQLGSIHLYTLTWKEGLDCEVTQIGAYTDNKAFSQYVTPSTKPISASAIDVTGLAIRDNIMYKNGCQVLNKTTREALQSFIDWTKQYTRIILVAHNAICLIQELLCVYLKQWDCVPVTSLLDLLTLCHYVENLS